MFGKYCWRAALAALGVCPFATVAHELGAHVHGVATLQVAVDAQTLTLDFSSPLDNLIGFEHPPRDDKQKAAVQTMADRLNHADSLFVATAEAQCALQSVKLDSPVLGAKPAVRREDERAHADLDGEFVFSCRQPDKLRGLDVRLFDAFPNLHKVKVEVATAKKQAAAELDANRHRVEW